MFLRKSFSYLLFVAATVMVLYAGVPRCQNHDATFTNEVDLLSYYPIGPGHGYELITFCNNGSLESNYQRFEASDDKGVCLCHEKAFDLTYQQYYVSRPSGIYFSSTKEGLIGDQACLYLPARVKRGDKWLMGCKNDRYYATFNGQIDSYLGVKGDYVAIGLVPTNMENHFFIEWVLMRGYGLVGFSWVQGDDRIRSTIFKIGIDRRFFIDFMKIERAAP